MVVVELCLSRLKMAVYWLASISHCQSFPNISIMVMPDPIFCLPAHVAAQLTFGTKRQGHAG